MNNPPPVGFAEKAKQPPTPSGGYPLQLSATDLDKNFVYATLQADETWIEEGSGTGGHTMRTLKLPAIPASGKYVLGATDGELVWLETEDC